MLYSNDKRIVLTLDAGGTNFNFSAVQSNKEIVGPVNYPVQHHSLEHTLKLIIDGFDKIRQAIGTKISAISFCFPGPADYTNGIIGDLENLPEFKGGVALKAMLENEFQVPVFINNDGDLFTYGEAIAGLLPEVNRMLENAGSGKRYHNLLGLTFGTGFGAGMVTKGMLYKGDNSSAAEINRMQNWFYPRTSIEDSCSIRAVKREFAREAGITFEEAPEPKDIYRIATGKMPGNIEAARNAYDIFAEASAYAVTNALTMTDSLVVIGGGLSGAHEVFLDRLVEKVRKPYTSIDDKEFPHLETGFYNLENPAQLNEFLIDNSITINVPFSEKTVKYNPEKKNGIGVSRLGTSKAVGIGAYAFALNELDM